MFSNFSKNEKMKLLVDNLLKQGIIKSEKVYNAMLQVDRGDFIDPSVAYMDR